MQGDIESLKKGDGLSKVISPPKNLPTDIKLENKLEDKPEIKQGIRKEVNKMALKEVIDKVEGIREEARAEQESEVLKPIEPPKSIESIKQRLAEHAKKADEKRKLPISAPPKLPKLNSVPVPPVSKPKLKPAKKNKLLFLIIFVIVIILGIIGGLLYWLNYIREPATYSVCQDFQCVVIEGKGADQCLSDIECLPPEPEKPIPLISVSGAEIIEVNTGEEDKFLDNLNKIASKSSAKGSLRQVLVKKSNTNTKEKSYTSLSEFIDLIGIYMPLSLRTYFGENYTLFTYTPSADMEEYYQCQESNIITSDCYGSRLGLVIELSDIAKAKQELLNWEPVMLNDLKPFILANASSTQEIIFQDSTEPNYKDADFIRYINLPISSISIDYAIKNNLLIIATSKNSLRAAIDILNE